MLERALARHLATRPIDALGGLAAVRLLIDLAERRPTQTMRSEEQIDAQQFSTLIDLAATACLLAAPTPDDTALEPSAGNGLLIAQLARSPLSTSTSLTTAIAPAWFPLFLPRP